MKKIIFNNLFKEIVLFFIACSVTLTLIVWILQAVNFLDIVSEDGHSIATYFMYSFMNIPKIFNKLLLLSFFLSLFYILTLYEDRNQTLIFWINGISKSQFLNSLIYLSFLFLIFSFFLSFFIVPFTQDKARSFIRSSSLEFFPSLIKPKKFIDTVENLTIFLDEKNKDSLKNIIIKDSKASNSQLIIAKQGFISSNEDKKFLNLNEGIIINYGNQNLTSFNFEKTRLNLSNYNTKTTITPKIQETKSKTIIKCINLLYFDNEIVRKIENLKCQKNILKNLTQEIYKRIFLPFYIPLICIISCFVILKSSSDSGYRALKYKVFLLGIFFVILAQISINMVSLSNFFGIATILIPIVISTIVYFLFIFKMKGES
tara:strand:- start:568 stop:1686 length:1119 start_codon:yes stop_codon:yes gene_type:complete